jgi:hypothetical protein
VCAEAAERVDNVRQGDGSAQRCHKRIERCATVNAVLGTCILIITAVVVGSWSVVIDAVVVGSGSVVIAACENASVELQ